MPSEHTLFLTNGWKCKYCFLPLWVSKYSKSRSSPKILSNGKTQQNTPKVWEEHLDAWALLVVEKGWWKTSAKSLCSLLFPGDTGLTFKSPWAASPWEGHLLTPKASCLLYKEVRSRDFPGFSCNNPEISQFTISHPSALPQTGPDWPAWNQNHSQTTLSNS